MAADTPHNAARTAVASPDAIKTPNDAITHGMTPIDASRLSNQTNSLSKPSPTPDAAAQRALPNPGNFIDGLEDKGKTMARNAGAAAENMGKAVETIAVSGIKGAEAAAANGAKAAEGAAATVGKAAGAAAGDALTAVGNAIITPAKAETWDDGTGTIYSGDRNGTYVNQSNGDIDTRVAGGHVNSRGFTPDQ